MTCSAPTLKIRQFSLNIRQKADSFIKNIRQKTDPTSKFERIRVN